MTAFPARLLAALRTGRPAALAGAVAGAVAATGQAPLGWWWAALPALAAVVALVARQDRGAGLVAWAAGAGYFAAALNWITDPFLVEPETYGWMAPFALVLLAGGLALFWAAAGVVSHHLFPARRALGFALALTATELARGYVLTGFPWALPGHIWIGTPPAQLAALIGANGLTLFTLLLAALLSARRLAPALAGAALLALGTGFGLWRLALPEPPPRDGMVRLVQPNAEQSLKWDPAQADIFFRRLLDLTRSGPAPALTVWPETAVPYLLDDNPSVALAIAAAGRGAPVATGIQRVEGWRFWNSLAIIGAGGGVGPVYDKHHLVPFGEYIPLGDLALRWFGLRAFAAQQGNGYSAGPGPAVLDLGPLGQVLPLICYEAVFPQDLRTATRADWILQITNDAWFGTLTGPYQHLAQAELRAVEQGLPLLRVANTGITAVIDARGRMLQSLPLGAQGSLDAAIPGALPATPYSRWGETPLLVLLAGLGAALRLVPRRKSA